MQRRWLVTFEGKEYADEELFESSFEHVISSGSDNEPSPIQPPAPAVATRKSRKTKNRGASKSESETERNNKKAVTFVQDHTAITSDSSAHNNNRSARDQRTVRRQNRNQAGDKDHAHHPKVTEEKLPANNKKDNNKRAVAPSADLRVPKKAKGASGDEEVVKVPMLTGTLYLYKGIRRRAEFIRKY